MAELHLVKNAGALKPAYQVDAEKFDKLKNNVLLFADIKQPRNAQFHRKFFAMLNLGFEYWEPPEIEVDVSPNWKFWKKDIRKVKLEKNFDRFRKDALILAGYYDHIINIKGEPRLDAKSISFAKMDETAFQGVYKNVFSVIWKLVLSNTFETEQDAENAIDELMSFS